MKAKKILRWVLAVSLFTFASLSFAVEAAKQLDLKPGFNFFSKQQDIATGKEAASKVEQQLPLLDDPQVLEYMNTLGRRLTQFEPLPADYPWSFRVVNTKDI